MKKRVENDDAAAIHLLGCFYRDGDYGLRRNMRKAIKLWLRPGELGYLAAYHDVASSYENGEGVERDENKAKYYYELAAVRGNVLVRHTLGILEEDAGNMNRAVKHWMISAGAGYDNSLKAIRVCFMDCHVTKDVLKLCVHTKNRKMG